jgi:hypothetical protein
MRSGDWQWALRGSLALPYLARDVGGQPTGATARVGNTQAGNTRGYGSMPATAIRSDVPWAALDGAANTSGYNLAPGYVVFETGACFIAGTLVHTKDGLVPIEKLKVGDWVLSAPENGEGERAYKRVVKTMVRHDQPIMQVIYKAVDKVDPAVVRYEQLTSTYDHPFWAEEEGWTAASRLKGGYTGPSRVRLADGSNSDLEGKAYIYCTDRPGVGWVADEGRQGEGWQWDYDNGRHAAEGRMGYDSDKWAPTDDDMYEPFRTTVFNIEVEEFHTYFVGEHGVWVHNANCDGIKLWVGEGDPGALLPNGTQLGACQ